MLKNILKNLVNSKIITKFTRSKIELKSMSKIIGQ